MSANLQDIILKQKAILTELEREADDILHSDLSLENEALKAEVQQLRSDLGLHSEKLKLIEDQNKELKNALYEQIYSEKIKIINAALKKNEVYFKSGTDGELNKLALLERDLIGRINRMLNELQKYRVEAAGELYEKLTELSVRVSETVTEARARLAKEEGAFSEFSAEQFERLKDEQITDEVITSIGRKNNLEAFVGGNLINKLGVLFVILGIIAVSRFTFFQLPDTFKGIIMFAVSGVLLAAGEFLNRKKANVFSLGLTSGGVAGLYASLSISYFALYILDMYPALFLCLLITAVAFVLSQRYNSQTVAAFALIGGYIPIISISESLALTYSAMVYFVALNLLALTISFYKKWKISMFIGYFLNLAGTLYIVFNMFYTLPPRAHTFGLHKSSTILYVLFAFTVYTLIPVLSNYRRKQPFSKPDVVVLGLNTVFSALIMYVVFAVFDISKFNGLMAIAFAIIYIGLGRFVETRFAAEKHTTALFYLTGFTFVVLVVPFQFGREWLSLGWLIQGVSLAAYGILTDEKNFKRAGFIIGAFCLAAFMYFDVWLEIDDLFSYKYFAVTLGSAIVLAAFAYKKSLASARENIYKYAALVNLWFYVLYLITRLDAFLHTRLSLTYYNSDFLLSSLAVYATFIIAFSLPRIPVISDKGTKILAVVISVFGMLGASAVISSYNITSSAPIPAQAMIIATLVLIAGAALTVFAMRSVLMFFVLETGLPVEWMPFGVSAYFLIVLTQNLIAQYGLSITSTVISILYVTAALAWIIYGFTKRFAFMRRFGLGLSILAVAKLFLVDLPGLTQGYKIVSYFAFGVTLLGISFVYQYFSKRLVPIGGSAHEDEILHKFLSVKKETKKPEDS